MTKATVSDSVKSLILKNFVYKQQDPSDSRSFTIRLTKEGKEKAYLVSFFTKQMEDSLCFFDESRKKDFLDFLLVYIQNLNQSGTISVQRFCFSCSNYQRTLSGHFCKLLNKTLIETEIRIDCSEHEEGFS